MSERFPWDEVPEDEPDAPRAETSPSESALQMELEPDAGPTDEPLPPATPAAAPPEAAPVVQPDGDPRRPEQAGSPTPGRPESEPPAVRPHGDPLRPAPRERPVARKEYYSIGEVSELAGLPPHVLRYWESQFPVLNPSKNRSGNRAYQRKEIKLILLVKHLLYEEKYTVEGAKAKLDQLRKGGLLSEHTARALDAQTVALLREEVAQLRELLAP